MFGGRAEKDVVCPAVQNRPGQIEVAMVHLFENGKITIDAVRGHGDHVVARPQAQIFRQLDGAQHVADPRRSE